MWFLIKCAFWLSLVVMFLPVSDEGRRAGVHEVSTGQAVSALTAALTDIRGFCSRNPDACTTGTQALNGFGYRAHSGARMLQDFISQQLDDSRHLTPPPGSARPALNGRDTLDHNDREPAWRGPDAPQVHAQRRG